MNLFDPQKFARGHLAGIDSNAFSLLCHFSKCAKESGWTEDEISLVKSKACESTYDALIACLMAHLSTNSDDLKVGILFPPITEDEFKADQEKLDIFIANNTTTGSYPYTFKNPNSYFSKVATAVYEIIDYYNRTTEFFYKDDGVDHCGHYAAFLETETNDEVSALFSKLRKHLLDDSKMYENFLAHLLKMVLSILDTDKDRDTETNFNNYECYYAIKSCECCGVQLPVDQMSDEYGEWRCMSCHEDEDEDE